MGGSMGGSMGGRDPRAAEREEARLVASRLPAELQALRAQVHLTRVRARARVRVRIGVRARVGVRVRARVSGPQAAVPMPSTRQVSLAMAI